MRRKALALFSSAVAAIALAACSAPVTTGKPSENVGAKDIASAADGVHLGSGWYPLEHYEGQTFRWVNNDAEITVCPAPAHGKLAMELEPGPSLGSRRLIVDVRSLAGTAQRIDVSGHRIVSIALAKEVPQTLLLHVQSRSLPVPHEKRTLNFRVFSVSLDSNASACPKDIVRDGSPITLGPGWYGHEVSAGESFRWVNNNAVITMTKPIANTVTIEADAEPGPGLAGAPMLLTLVDSTGRMVAKAQPMMQRGIASLTVTAAKPNAKYALHVTSPGKRVAGDPRILNFRVFDVHVAPAAK